MSAWMHWRICINKMDWASKRKQSIVQTFLRVTWLSFHNSTVSCISCTQIKLKKFCPSIPIKFSATSQHSATKWGWLVQRSCFGQLAIPRTILEISLVSLLGKRCFSSTRNSLSLTILLHEHICPIFDFFVIFWPIMTWCTQLHADLFFWLFHI